MTDSGRTGNGTNEKLLKSQQTTHPRCGGSPLTPLLNLSQNLTKTRRYEVIFTPEMLCGICFDPKTDPDRPWLITEYHQFILRDAKTGRQLLVQEIFPGLRTDFASIPWFLGWLFPKNGWHTRACAFHDGGYIEQNAPRVLFDLGLRVIMNEDRPKDTVVKNIFTWVQANLIWLGVRLFGWWAWKTNQKERWEGY